MLTAAEFSRNIGNGGVTAREIDRGGMVSWTAGQEDVSVYVVRDDGDAATRALLTPGEEIEAPGGGERAWLVAVYPHLGSTSVTVRLD
jgi:hypothetical protein